MLNLSEWVTSDLENSGIIEATASEMRVSVVSDAKEGTIQLKKLLGYSQFDNHPITRLTESYILPYPWSGYGRIKLRHELKNGTRYLAPKEKPDSGTTHLYFLSGEKEKLDKVKCPLLIVEGEKKTAKVTQEIRKLGEYCVVGVAGNNMWHNCPEWRHVRKSGRDIYIAFDSDFRTNPDVQLQLVSMWLWLRKKKAGSVNVIVFPEETKGIDDYYVSQEKKGRESMEVSRELMAGAVSNVFSLLTSIGIARIPEVLLNVGYTDVETSILWSDLGLKAVTSVGKTDMVNSLRQVRQEKKKREKEKPVNVGDSRPKIYIAGGDLPQMVDAAEQVLLANPALNIYQRNGFLLRVVAGAKSPRSINRSGEALTLRGVDVTWLVDILTQLVQWEKKGIGTPSDCPKAVAETYLARYNWKIPVLTGIITAPTLRADGGILEKPGYDMETGLLFYRDTVFPSVPKNPSHSDAKTALQTFLHLLQSFPFVNDADKAVAIAAILTGLIRPSLRTAPMTCFSAPKRRSGKTLLSDIAALIATGRPATKLHPGKTPEEAEKRFFSILLAGDQFVCLDNLEYALDSEALAIILTEDECPGRVLGESKIVKATTGATTWTATGNNLALRGDVTSRSLRCEIDPACEHPESRLFSINLLGGKHILACRADLVIAGLTMLRAFRLAKKQGQTPKAPEPWGGFDDWSAWVRETLIWCGTADPCETRKKIEESDPEREGLMDFLTAWHEYYGENWVYLSDLKSQIDKGDMYHSQEHEALKSALLLVAGKGDGISSRKLAWFFRKNRNKIADGFKIARGEKKKNRYPWRVLSPLKLPVDEKGESVSYPLSQKNN